MADSGHPPAELHERLLICRTIKLNAGAHGGHRRCCHAQMQKNAQNKPQIARLILCVHTTLQVYCNLFLTFCCQNPSILQREMLVEIDQPGAGKLKITGNPIKLSQTPPDPCHPAPLLGQDTQEVLRDTFGFSDTQISKWKEENIV